MDDVLIDVSHFLVRYDSDGYVLVIFIRRAGPKRVLRGLSRLTFATVVWNGRIITHNTHLFKNTDSPFAKAEAQAEGTAREVRAAITRILLDST